MSIPSLLKAPDSIPYSPLTTMRRIIIVLVFLLGSSHFVSAHTTPVQKYEAELELYRKEREMESRPEQRQRLTAMCVRSLRALGRTSESYQEFFALCRTAPFSTHFDCIPLVWFTSRPFTPVGITADEKLALQWIHPKTNPSGIENPAASLLAASILLSSAQPANRTRAMEQLEQLSFFNSDANSKESESQVRRQISLLAQMQLRRVKIATLKEESELQQWKTTFENLPAPLQAGPQYVLGLGYTKLQNEEQAILCWMRVPILHSEDRPLAAQSLLEAAKSLRKLNRPEQEQTLLNELRRDYPDVKNVN